MGMRKNLKVLLSLTLAAVMLFIAGCSTTKSQDKTKVQTATNNVKVEPMGKYTTPIKLTLSSYYAAQKYPDGESAEKNIWYDGYKNDLGIEIENINVTGNATAYDQKLGILVASNSLPDMIYSWDRNKSFQYFKDDLIADLTEAYDKYLLPEVKAEIEKTGSKNFITDNGKVYALAHKPETVDSKLVIVRYDWLKKLNLPEPKNFQDLIEIARAFTKKDPDGNGKNDTYGLPLEKDLTALKESYAPYYGTELATVGVLPQADGTRAPAVISPQSRKCIEDMVALYKEGVFLKDFGTRTQQMVRDDFNKGVAGITFANPGPVDAKKVNPSAEFKSYNLKKLDGSNIESDKISPPGGYWLVNKSCKNPEALIKMENYNYSKLYIDGSNKWRNPVAGYNTHLHCIGPRVSPGQENWENYRAIKQAIETKSEAGLKEYQKDSYNKVIEYEKGNTSDPLVWATWYTLNPKTGTAGMQIEASQYRSSYLPFLGTSNALNENGATLNKLRDEVFTKIIMGAGPISDFDKFVTDFKKLGGDEINKEINAWIKENLSKYPGFK